MSDLAIEARGPVLWVTITRTAQRNALSAEAIAALQQALEEADNRDDIRVLCITGAGDRAFCAGADLSSAFAGGQVEDAVRGYARLLARMLGGRKPIVARVAGHCLAGGLGLLLASDLAVAARRAQFWTPELDVGLFPMMVAALLVRTVGRRRAAEMLYTGRRYTADEAAAMGLVTRAVDDARLDAEVEGLLETLAGKAPLALERGRAALAQTESLPPAEALDTLADHLLALLRTEDAAEGMAAFLQKRPPQWRGR